MIPSAFDFRSQVARKVDTNTIGLLTFWCDRDRMIEGYETGGDVCDIGPHLD